MKMVAMFPQFFPNSYIERHQSVTCLAELQQGQNTKAAKGGCGAIQENGEPVVREETTKRSTCLTKQRLRSDMIILYKHLKGLNVKEEEELLKLKDNVGTTANGYKLAMNKNRQKIGGGWVYY
ncbi:hypothetical protein DUI87_17167 [Hirundo rustica rustica]|uniref:Uncharacterized protein n=1 Tax=Hirundo rustica rustica TaxID=333673 RepID=A0A3M0K9F7_HIRRU|nr:hypothetical protein DUI87_17167 [Hirundo rustica rustica]